MYFGRERESGNDFTSEKIYKTLVPTCQELQSGKTIKQVLYLFINSGEGVVESEFDIIMNCFLSFSEN